MAKSEPFPQNPNDDEEEIYDDDDGDDDGDDEYDDDDQPETPLTKAKVAQVLQRLQSELVPIRVHDVIIEGNSKTKYSIIEAEIERLKEVSSMQELMEVSKIVNFKLQALEVFDAVKIRLDSGPPELPGTANVVIKITETKNPLTGEVGVYTKGEARFSTVEGSLKYKNIFGLADLWDASLAYGGDHMAEASVGVYLPRFKGLKTPTTARVFLLSQDWLRFSSFKERSLGLSLGLLSSRNHDLAYNLSWRTLTDPSQMASSPVRRQLGHALLSSLKYTFKIDNRSSPMRPMSGYAFVSTTQVGGLAPDSRSLRFLRQELDFRYALPFGFSRTVLNLGISGGVIFPWGSGFTNMPSPLPERFFLGGNLSPIGSLGGPQALYGFRARGMGPTESRRELRRNPNDDSADPGRDYLGGDVAVTAFADLSFDFPLKWCQAKGIHGHLFASSGNVGKLTQNAYKSFSLRKFAETFRTTVGAGIVLPTPMFRMELNYCYILKDFDHDCKRSGFRVSFSTPSP
ncbi:Outer membrane OMP85 family protein [Euphorbia peplus]|nr:Outer membrane OMP85 family protein [Euphorbia peplus]